MMSDPKDRSRFPMKEVAAAASLVWILVIIFVMVLRGIILHLSSDAGAETREVLRILGPWPVLMGLLMGLAFWMHNSIRKEIRDLRLELQVERSDRLRREILRVERDAEDRRNGL